MAASLSLKPVPGALYVFASENASDPVSETVSENETDKEETVLTEDENDEQETVQDDSGSVSAVIAGELESSSLL